MADDRQARQYKGRKSFSISEQPAERQDEYDGSQNQQHRLLMQRGVSQLLFNYLPGRTVDWEDGLAIMMLEGVRLSRAWDQDRAAGVLEEIAQLFERWRSRGGSLDPHFPDPRTEQGSFTVGLPQAIEATVLHTALVCPRCGRLSFPRRVQIAHMERGDFSCVSCGGRGLRQIPWVFVHGCGELAPISEWIPATRRGPDGSIEPTNRPIRCPRCGTRGELFMPLRSERVKDMKIVCQHCDTQVVDRLTARCGRCLEAAMRRRRGESESNQDEKQRSTPEETIVTRIAMRASRYSASDAYYPQTLSMLRLDRPILSEVVDDEQSLLRRMLPASQRPGSSQRSADALGSLVQKLQSAEAAKNSGEVERIRRLIVQVASGTPAMPEVASDENLVPASPDLEKALRESLAFRQTVSLRFAMTVASQSGGSSELLLRRIDEARMRLGIKELLLVDDLPVITATFGYTRRSFEPTYEELSAKSLPTRICAFPSLQRPAAQHLGRPELVGTIPILAREGEHEGIFVSLEPDQVLRWLYANGIDLPSPELPPIARILRALEPVDRYYDDVWRRPIRRMVFGLIHSLSHMIMRTVGRFAGLERTSLGEYIFLPLLGAVVFDNSSAFRLGGIETLVRDQLSAFLDALGADATECLYDAACIDHRGACHGCIHSPEISCRVFNHGLSRAFLVGGHAPWTDVTSDMSIAGYWALDGLR